MDVTEIDRVISNVINFHIEEAVQKEAPSTSFEESIALVQEVAVQKEPPSEEKWKCENSEEELTQEELSQSQTDPAEYWKRRAKLQLQMLNNAIKICHFKNSIIEKIIEENDALQKDNKDLQKQNKKLEKEKKELEKQKSELEKKNTALRQQKKKWDEENNELQEMSKGLLKEKNDLEWQQQEVETEKEKKTEKHVHQDSATDSATKSETIKNGDKIVIASDQEVDIQDIYWSSTANELSYYDNIVMKEDMHRFLEDD
ncbi:uncharacterized protein [Malus domestica]|uniref:uncharacterized protein n=1 Tax=Malus domestica TaxID=3750 RepID=UPI00397591CC